MPRMVERYFVRKRRVPSTQGKNGLALFMTLAGLQFLDARQGENTVKAQENNLLHVMKGHGRPGLGLGELGALDGEARTLVRPREREGKEHGHGKRRHEHTHAV